MKKLVLKTFLTLFFVVLSGQSFAGSITSEDLALKEMEKQDRVLAMAEQQSFNRAIREVSTEEAIDDAFDLMGEANQD